MGYRSDHKSPELAAFVRKFQIFGIRMEDREDTFGDFCLTREGRGYFIACLKDKQWAVEESDVKIRGAKDGRIIKQNSVKVGAIYTARSKFHVIVYDK